MSNENEEKKENIVFNAFKFINKYIFSGTDTWEGFLQRKAALQIVADRLQAAEILEEEVAKWKSLAQTLSEKNADLELAVSDLEAEVRNLR